MAIIKEIQVPDTNLDFDKPEWEYFSVASSNDTADDLPGAGRILGNFSRFAGGKLEVLIGRIAIALGHGPKATTGRIRKAFYSQTKREKIIQMELDKLRRYIR